MLVTLSDFPDGFDDKQVLDVCISTPSGGGSVQRVLSRQRQTLRAAVQLACVLAEQVAASCGETIIAPGQRPSVGHLTDGDGGCTLCLNYDLGQRGQAHPRVVRSLRLYILVRHESSAEPPRPTTGPALSVARTRSQPTS